MDALTLILQNLQAASAGLIPILYTLFVAAGLDTLSGIWAAWKSGTLKAVYVTEFIKSHIVTKITPIMLLLIAGVSMGGTDTAGGVALVAAGGAAATAYMLSVVASIRNNLSEGNDGTKGAPSSVKLIEAVPITTQPLTDAADPS